MAINVSDLPSKYQTQVLRQYIASDKVQSKKQAKYRNQPTDRVTRTGETIRFDSLKEARRYDCLLTLLANGHIRDLRLQADFTLQEAYTDASGYRVRAIRYKADFTYYRRGVGGTWEFIVEDVKSRATITKTYCIKKKLLKERFNLDITEV